MSIGKFCLADIATIKISANGKTQTIDIAGPLKLKENKNEEDKTTKKSTESSNVREIPRREGFSKGGGVE